MTTQTVVHNIPPLYDSESRVLLLGSIPSPKSREVGFFYGHPQNRFWRVLAAVLGEELPATIAEKRAMCLKHHIALWDTIARCDIAGASDTSIKTPYQTTSAACCGKAKSSASSPPAANPPSCTASWSNPGPMCPSSSSLPPARRTPPGRSSG